MQSAQVRQDVVASRPGLRVEDVRAGLGRILGGLTGAVWVFGLVAVSRVVGLVSPR